MTANIDTPQQTVLLDTARATIGQLRDAVSLFATRGTDQKTGIATQTANSGLVDALVEVGARPTPPAPYTHLYGYLTQAVNNIEELVTVNEQRNEIMTRLLHIANQLEAIVAYDAYSNAHVELPKLKRAV